MMLNIRAGVAGLVAVSLLAGCNSLGVLEKKIDYKTAAKAKLPPLEIPPDLTTPRSDDRYALPEGKSATYSAYSRERAAEPKAETAGGVLPQPQTARIERAGTQRWLVVNMPPDQAWPTVKQFWEEMGFSVKTELPEAGVMETEWAENRAKIPQDFLRRTIGKVLDQAWSTPERDKFRTRLERGATPGTTEIYVSHRGMMEIYTTEARDSTVWQPRPADPELEAEMLGRLMARFGVKEQDAAKQVKTAADEDRATLNRTADGARRLALADPFDRAWRRVGLALDRIGFTVEDRDRSQGLYFVRYIDPETDNASKEDKGLLSKLAFWRSSAKPSDKREQYRVHISAAGDTSLVEVQNAQGSAEQSATAQKILSLLHGQLK